MFKNLAAFAPIGTKNVRSFSRAACASKRMLQPAMMCTRMTPSADLSAAMNSSIVVCMFSVAAVIVTGATPLVGMLWLMVSIFAPFSAKIARSRIFLTFVIHNQRQGCNCLREEDDR